MIKRFFSIYILPTHPGGRFSYFTAKQYSRAVLPLRVSRLRHPIGLEFSSERIARIEWSSSNGKQRARLIPPMCFTQGKHPKEFHKTWRMACVAIGVARLDKAGVPEAVAR
jgi:hypothetical protein